MPRRRALVIAVLALAACKDDKPKTSAAKPTPDAAAAAVAPDAAARTKPLAPPAEPPVAATGDDCKNVAEYAVPMFKVAAEARKVPADKSDAVAKDLAAAFLEMCGSEAWPRYFAACVAKSPPDLETYKRCFERLPARKRFAWNARLDSILGPAGGTTYPQPPDDGTQGTTLEELCPVFIAESGRFDICAGGAMYMPELEQVYALARKSQGSNGLIPPEHQPALKALCDERAQLAREATTSYCP
jgi:hypothetical protein